MIFLFKIGFLEIKWIDIFDILFVSVLIYQVYKLMKGSVAIRIFLGFLLLYLLYLMVNAAGMDLLGSILGQFMGVGILAAIILFQQEIRKFLFLVGKTTVFNKDNLLRNLPWIKQSNRNLKISPVIEAAKSLEASKTGALIVFSKNTELKFYANSGDIIDAQLSKRLLLSIFNKYSPLHDGAVIIHANRIKAARCILPVSESEDLPAQFGLRHRAAVGMSEITDTLILIVSEEMGTISTVKNGHISHNLSISELKENINEYFEEEQLTGVAATKIKEPVTEAPASLTGSSI